MTPTPPQIFQTQTRSRWQRYRLTRIAVILLVCGGLVGVYYGIKKGFQPDMPLQDRAIKRVLTGEIPMYRESDLGKEYRGFRKYIFDHYKKNRFHKDGVLDLSESPLFSDSLGIRAGFYVGWEPQSLISLKNNIGRMNLVVPEWFFIGDGDTLYTTLNKDQNQRALEVVTQARVAVMPMLSNFDSLHQKFRGDVIHRIIHDPKKKERLINDLVNLLGQYKFAGINVDFEELNEDNDEALVQFQQELYTRLHAANYLVTQDVIPFDDDYNFSELAKYNDYIFLMAYDQSSDDTKPGPIGTQRWVEAAVDELAQEVPVKKIVLCMAAYGYDWQKKGPCTTITYDRALTTAQESDGVVDFDNDTYNLHYSYYDDDDDLHDVYFTDAATNFNSLRFATEYGLAGTALWRLGSEDSRLWQFYHIPMTKSLLKNFDVAEFSKVDKRSSKPDYVGDGEVLDILSSPADGHVKPEIDTTEMLISEEIYDKLPSTYLIRKLGKPKTKKVVITFDDGPDPVYTPQILDTLSHYHVPAVFFLIGFNAENNIPLVKRIYREGHEIGNHTFFHPNMAAVSSKRAGLEIDATRLLIECIIGRSTILFRAPFNADSEPGQYEELAPVALSRTRNYLTVGESIDPEDWQMGEIPNFNADTIYERVVRAYNSRVNNPLDSTDLYGSIILLHDSGGDRTQTVKAAGMIIRFFQSKGYQFTTVADLLGKSRDALMPEVPHTSGYYLLQVNYAVAMAGYILGSFFAFIFVVFLLLSAVRLLTIGVLAILEKKRDKKFRAPVPTDPPLISIIVPAYNEEVNAVSSLHNLLRCDYPDFEIIFVDDGSKDSTFEKVKTEFEHHPKIKVFTKVNGGKASALNYGISQSHADYVVCIDADTKLMPDAVSKLMGRLYDSRVGAVAGVVKVGNEVNMLTNWQSVEYITSQNFDRKAFAYVNAITVVPGAIGGFNKDALLLAGGFTVDTLAEDCDLTVRILRAGYIVDNEPKAIAYTEAPEKLNQFMKQRLRWSFGVMQTFWKHKDLMFNSNYGALGWIAFPDILLFKYIIPLFTPVADLLMVLGLFTESRGKIGVYYLIFMLVDALIGFLAFALEKERNPWRLLWLLPQRLVYRWIMLVVLFRSYRRAIKGELQQWGALKRTGNVKDIVVQE